MSENIHILHVVNSLNLGGVELQLLNFIKQYDRKAFKIDVCVIGKEIGKLEQEVRNLDTKILSCRKSPNLLSFSQRFRNTIVSENYGIVHSHLDAWSGAILKGASMAGVPVRIAQIHSIMPWAEDLRANPLVRYVQNIVVYWGRRWVSQYATHVLAVSHSVRDNLSNWLANKDILIWSAGINLNKFFPSRGWNQDFKILSVGGLLKAKKVDITLKIFRKVLDVFPQAKLIVAGIGPEEMYLRNLCDHLNMSASVDFTGTSRNIPELMKSAALLITSSSIEGLPTVILEAQACGIPVVASAIAPNIEALADELLPFTFPINNTDVAANKVTTLLSNTELRMNLRENLPRYVNENFNSERQLPILENLYKEAYFLARA
jgi:glycosyltransferase EpsF